MAKVQFKKLNEAHSAIMDWIMVNPGGTYAQCGQYFGYTPQAVCYIVNSDVFRSRLAERRAEVEGLIHADIPAKLSVLAATSMEKLQDKVNETNDPDLLVDIWDKALHRLGYGASKGGNTTVAIQNNATFAVSPAELEQAKAVMLQVAGQVPRVLEAPVEVEEVK